jgi:hypothetical protein
MKAQAAAKIRDLHDRAERKRGEIKADVADDDAKSAEGAAVDTLDYASWTVQQAELSVLYAIDARARADERAAESGAR